LALAVIGETVPEALLPRLALRLHPPLDELALLLGGLEQRQPLQQLGTVEDAGAQSHLAGPLQEPDLALRAVDPLEISRQLRAVGRRDADDAVPEAQHADLGGRLRVSLEEQARQPVPERDGEGRLPLPAGPALLDLGHGPRQVLQMVAGLLAARGAGARAQRLRAARNMSHVDGRPGLIRPLRDETDAGTMELQMRELRHVSPEEEYLAPAERIERRILAEGEGGARGSAAAPATLPRLEQRKAGRRGRHPPLPGTTSVKEQRADRSVRSDAHVHLEARDSP